MNSTTSSLHLARIYGRAHALFALVAVPVSGRRFLVFVLFLSLAPCSIPSALGHSCAFFSLGIFDLHPLVLLPFPLRGPRDVLFILLSGTGSGRLRAYAGQLTQTCPSLRRDQAFGRRFLRMRIWKFFSGSQRLYCICSLCCLQWLLCECCLLFGVILSWHGLVTNPSCCLRYPSSRYTLYPTQDALRALGDCPGGLPTTLPGASPGCAVSLLLRWLRGSTCLMPQIITAVPPATRRGVYASLTVLNLLPPPWLQGHERLDVQIFSLHPQALLCRCYAMLGAGGCPGDFPSSRSATWLSLPSTPPSSLSSSEDGSSVGLDISPEVLAPAAEGAGAPVAALAAVITAVVNSGSEAGDSSEGPALVSRATPVRAPLVPDTPSVSLDRDMFPVLAMAIWVENLVSASLALPYSTATVPTAAPVSAGSAVGDLLAVPVSAVRSSGDCPDGLDTAVCESSVSAASSGSALRTSGSCSGVSPASPALVARTAGEFSDVLVLAASLSEAGDSPVVLARPLLERL